MQYDVAVESADGGLAANDDRAAYWVAPDHGAACFVVADGLGGHHGGGHAAALAVGAVIDRAKAGAGTPPAQLLSEIFAAAEQRVQTGIRENPSLADMRTTCTVLYIRGDLAYWGHVGDTRLYHFQTGQLLHRTLDHSVPQMLVNTGEITAAEISGHPERNRLLKCLGARHVHTPTLQSAGVRLGGEAVFLLCSDGYWERMPETELGSAIRRWNSAAKLASLNWPAGSGAAYTPDNATVLVVCVREG